MTLDLLGRKLGTTQIFTDSGERVAVTVIQAGPCTVVQKKLPERDGYCAVQLGFEEVKEKHATKPLLGHFRKASVSPKRFLYEVRLSPEEAASLEVGQQVRVAGAFEQGQCVDVTGRTRGRGFSGVIRRWSFKRQGRSHGTHEYERHGGAVSSGTDPGRVLKGKRLPGHYGDERVTTRNVRVAKVDAERGLLFLNGAVPGHRNGLVRVRAAIKPRKQARAKKE
jgi:large subunit ribosomal protein L3